MQRLRLLRQGMRQAVLFTRRGLLFCVVAPLLVGYQLWRIPQQYQYVVSDFPSRIVRVVVAFPAGGPTDFVARILADRLKPLLGQNVIVENRPGANGAIGADYVAKGEADGHLLFLTTVGAVAVTPHLSKPNYDTLRDFAPITLVARPTTDSPDFMGISGA